MNLYLLGGNNMKKRLTIIICLLSVFTVFAVAYNGDNKINTISVGGIGEISFDPDIAYVSVGVNGVFQDVTKGQKEINNKINNFLDKIKGIVPKDNISTERFSVNNTYEYVSGKRQFAGYTIDQNLKIKLKDLKLIGEVIDLAVENGLNNVGQIIFSSSKIDEYKQKALKQSLLDAKKKAELIAGTMNTGKIKIKQIQEVGSFVQPLRAEGMQMKALAVADTSTQYQVGDMIVNAQVNVIYEF